jgi:Tfp pilus assembly protein PilW
MRKQISERGQAGFSLLELVVAMGITIVVDGFGECAAGGFVQHACSRKSEDRSTRRRAARLNLMTREIANSGYGLTNIGLVAADSGLTSIRVRANLSFLGRNHEQFHKSIAMKTSNTCSGVIRTTSTASL